MSEDQSNRRQGGQNQRRGQNQQGGQRQSNQRQRGQRQGGQRQSGQRQGGQRQSRQQQGRQQQAGQQRRQQASRPPQGGGRRGGSPPGSGGGSGTGGFIAGISILSGLAGAIFGVLMVLVMKVGGFPVLPAATDTARQLAEAEAGTGGLQATGSAPSTVEMLNQGISTSHQVIISYMTAELAPFIAFGLALVVGTVVATQTSEGLQSKLTISGVGMLVGGLLVVVISSALVGFLGPSIPQSIMNTAGTEASVIDPGLASPQWGNIFINGAMTGVGAAGAAMVTVFSIDKFFDK